MTIASADLNKRNYVFAFDRSGSMGEAVKAGSSLTRWQAAKEASIAIARKCAELDDDGIDIYLFNTSFKFFPGTTADKVVEIFDKFGPTGGTDFVPVLGEILKQHFKTSADKPTTVIFVTDGQPSEASTKKDIAKLIVDATKKLESGDEIGISFLQIGEDAEAKAFLKKLDNDLEAAGAKFDIVNTKTFDELADISIEDALLAAVNE